MDKVKFFKEMGIRFVNEMPDGWAVIKEATTAPNGYVWINNKKPLFSGEYEHALLRKNV